MGIATFLPPKHNIGLGIGFEETIVLFRIKTKVSKSSTPAWD
jgi:hypothetical protein